MSYKFEKASVYYNENRLLELSAEVFKIAFDIGIENFKKVKNHGINSTYYSCSDHLDDDYLIHDITDDIALVISNFGDHKEHTRYGLYINTKDFNSDTMYNWYTICYVEDNDIENYIYLDNCMIRYNKNGDYIESSDFQSNYPFTKDMYFNYLMSSDLQCIKYEVLNDLLELKLPDGFYGYFYDY